MGRGKKRVGDELGLDAAPERWRRPKRRCMRREVADLGHKMPTPEDTIREFICNSMMQGDCANRDDQLMALALLSLPDMQMLVLDDEEEEKAMDDLSTDEGSARDSTSSTEKFTPLKPEVQVGRVCRWLSRVAEWPVMRRLRDLKLAYVGLVVLLYSLLLLSYRVFSSYFSNCRFIPNF